MAAPRLSALVTSPMRLPQMKLHGEPKDVLKGRAGKPPEQPLRDWDPQDRSNSPDGPRPPWRNRKRMKSPISSVRYFASIADGIDQLAEHQRNSDLGPALQHGVRIYYLACLGRRATAY